MTISIIMITIIIIRLIMSAVSYPITLIITPLIFGYKTIFLYHIMIFLHIPERFTTGLSLCTR